MASAATRKGTIKSNPNTCSPLPSSSVPIEMKTTEPSKDEEAALLGHMSQALEDLDTSLKREYETATEIIPEIVRVETPLVIFLRTDDYDAHKAARRLALYWKHRKDVFGERWLLPLTQDGRGALTLRETAFLRTGVIVVKSCPETKQTIIMMDQSKGEHVMKEAIQDGADPVKMLLRVSFYMATVCTDENCRRQGAILFHPLVSSHRRPLMEFRPELGEITRTAFPFKLAKLVIGQAYAGEGTKHLFDFMRYQTERFVEFNNHRKPLEVVADSQTETVRLLQAQGVARSAIPVALGGDFTYDTQIDQWIRRRLSVEEFLHSRPTIHLKTTSTLLEVSSSRCASSLVSTSSSSSSSSKTLAPAKTQQQQGHRRPVLLTKQRKADATDKKDFVKKRNALYSRRMYHKRKLELLSLREEVEVWQGRNRGLLREQARLQNLVDQARALLVRGEDRTTQVMTFIQVPQRYHQQQQQQQQSPPVYTELRLPQKKNDDSLSRQSSPSVVDASAGLEVMDIEPLWSNTNNGRDSSVVDVGFSGLDVHQNPFFSNCL